MKCEHAQEFFSEYVEKTLDKPSGVALEAHLTACAACRRDLEGLRQTWGALNATPAVEPPKDLAWRVMVQLQQERLERLEAERKRTNPFVGWLQALTPGAAFGYAVLVALLFVAIAFPLRPLIPQVTWGWGDRPVAVDTTPLMDLAAAQQDSRTGRWFMPLVITAPPDAGDSSVTISPMVLRGGQWAAISASTRALLPGPPQVVQVPVMVGTERVLAVRVEVQGTGGSPVVRELLARFTPPARPRVGM
jgi:hypothetical protein